MRICIAEASDSGSCDQRLTRPNFRGHQLGHPGFPGSGPGPPNDVFGDSPNSPKLRLSPNFQSFRDFGTCALEPVPRKMISGAGESDLRSRNNRQLRYLGSWAQKRTSRTGRHRFLQPRPTIYRYSRNCREFQRFPNFQNSRNFGFCAPEWAARIEISRARGSDLGSCD